MIRKKNEGVERQTTKSSLTQTGDRFAQYD